MALPATTKDVSENPSPTAVSAPTDKALKEADTERKLRLFGVIEAFRQGKYPSNAQCDETLKYVNANSPVDESKLSADGRTLVQDVRDIIETARLMVKEKNEGELMQNFLHHTRHIDGEEHVKNVKGLADTGPTTAEAKTDAHAASENLRTLAKLIYTSSETRKLLKDIGILARDVAADAAVKVADTARPAEHQLNQVDEPAPHNEWVGPNGEKRTHDDPVPDTGLAAKRDQAQDLANQAQGHLDTVKAEAADVADTAQAHGTDAANQVHGAATQDGVANGSQAQKDAAVGAAQSVGQEKADVAAGVAEEKKNKLKDAYGNVMNKIPEEHKERARQAKADGKEYLHDKFPKERQDRFIYRLKKVIVEQQRHRDYQDAVEFFLGMFETYQGHAKGVANAATEKGGDVRSDPAFKNAELELRTLLERFANGASMQPIFDAVNQIYVDAQDDAELRGWFKKLDVYVRKVLQEPGYVMREQCDADGWQVRDEGKVFWTQKYATHRQNLFDSIETFFTAYADDPLNVRFGQNWKQLVNHLFLNSEGNLALKPHLWEDICTVILPSMIRHVGYIPIPRIEYSDANNLDLAIDNLTLESQNLIPNIIEVEMNNYFKLSAYDAIKNRNKHSLQVSFSQVQADLRDVSFYFKKKSGFPKLTDSGIADVVISGKGLSGTVHVESSERPGSVFEVKSVKVKVDKLAFSIRDAKHSILYSTLRPLATGLIKKQIAKAIEDGIRSALSQLDQQLIDIKERMDAIEGVDDKSKFDAIKESFNAKRGEANQAAEKVQEAKGKFQITAKRDSKIVDWTSPNSMIERQGALADQASKNGSSGWKSDAFTIVR